MFSIRRYLLITLLSVAAVSMVATAWLSWREAVNEVEELFDAQLAQSARVLVATLTTRPLLMEERADDTVIFPVWRPVGKATGDTDDEEERDVATAGHKYETRLAFQLWEGAGERLLMRSENAPTVPLTGFTPGYSIINLGGERFHVFSVLYQGLWLQVAQDDYMRGELAGRIALTTLLPHAVGLPLMAFLIWWLVKRGLRPLDALRQLIAGRGVRNLAPLAVSPASVEVQPMVNELNDLLARLGASFERERRFTADAAHELRTPLAVLRIHAENALASADNDERQRALEMLLRGVDRASRLVEQMLILARVEPEAALRQFEALRLNALVREELAALVPMASRRDQDIDFVEEGEFVVNGDSSLLGILVRNLVDNALRYSPDGSLVHVALRRSAAGSIELVVLDEGAGVPAEQADRVFERFFRGETGRGDGAGLGLAIVKRIVDLHGGTIRVRPRVGEQRGGFIVVLPG